MQLNVLQEKKSTPLVEEGFATLLIDIVLIQKKLSVLQY